MGLRDRLKARVKQAGKQVIERIIGEGSEQGTGVSHSARTAAWPPGRMGADSHSEPPPHPVDLAEAGAYVEEHVDFALPMHIEEAVAEAAEAATVGSSSPSKRAPSERIHSEPAPTAPAAPEPAPAPKALHAPTGSVAQQEWLPMPKKAPPAPETVEEPVTEVASAGGSEAKQNSEPGEAAVSLSEAEIEAAKDEIVAVLKTVYDPEIPVDIYELGLIYGVDVAADGTAEIRMTLTSPNCPAAQSMPAEVEVKTRQVPGITDSMVDIVWDPPWGPDKMSEVARLELNIDF